MSSATSLSKAILTTLFAATLIGCSDEQGGSGAKPTQSATATATAAATATATAAPLPTATATATAEVSTRPCPKDSKGDGTLKSPCESKGKARMMEVQWTGKMDDAGPSFRVINKATETILFGKIVVYFYDQAGKQLEVKDDAGKARPNQPCSGNLFSGIMKPAEKAVVTFSCVAKKHVPEGTKFIEGELQLVGFSDETEKKSNLYWRNNDLTPDTRPKGGVK
jgi:hypothetical protein